MTYEAMRQYLTPEGEKNPSNLRKLLAGAVSGAIAQTCTFPLYGTLLMLLETKLISTVMFFAAGSKSTK